MVCGDLVVFQFGFFTIIHAAFVAKLTIKMNIADNSEFRAVLYDLVKGEHKRATVDAVLDAYDEATAIWLRHSEQPSEGRFFGRNREFVFKLRHEPEEVGHGIAEGTTEGEHYELHIKASAVLLRALSEKFGIPVKNG